MVAAVFADRATAPVSDAVKAALTLVDVFTLRPDEFDSADIDAARTAGLSDEAIEHVIDVATLFNLIDRLADAFEFFVPNQQGLDQGAKALLKFGYRFPPFLYPRP